jgi:ADP-dependent NAD(P)H-hydrate dehydratase / NAD(P)H-hydrate epimerase
VKPILTPQQAVELDRATQARGVPAATLMERAGWAVARAAVDLLGGTYGRRAVVVCGKGNNGGDGFVAARHLARWGMHVSVHALEPPAELREPAAGDARRLTAETPARLRPFSVASLERDLVRADVAIDAIFGTGFRGLPEDEWAAAIDALNHVPTPVVAVDIPSGVDGASGAAAGLAVQAALTVTFGAAKTGVVLLPGAELAGAVRVVDIGFPDDLVHADAWLTEPADVVRVWPRREADTHKRASGVLLVVAGSRGMTGAPRLIAEAAGRVGAGLVVVACPASVLPAVQAGLTEATFVPLPETEAGTIAEDAVDPLEATLERAHAVAIGPGLTTDEATASFVRTLVGASPVQLVIDADALNAYAGNAAALAGRRADAIVTPHVGEFARLTGVQGADLEGDRIGHVRRLASASGAVALLKGSRTVIAAPDGEVRVNPTGSAALATAGSGDVLTGVLGGLVARGVPALEAAAAGAYVHGLAGIFAARISGEGTVAGDLTRHLPEALAQIEALAHAEAGA